MNRYYSSNTIPEFINDQEDSILGKLTMNHSHDLNDLTKNSWRSQIRILKHQLQDFQNGQLYFEFSIPRMGKRVDNVLIIDDKIFLLEFKVGDNHYQKNAIEQVVGYSLDLKNFHEGSHSEKIIPILVSTKADEIDNEIEVSENLFKPLKTNKENLLTEISKILEIQPENTINIEEWENSLYKPTPTIIEAAQALYKGHNVKEISRNDAGAENLSVTSKRISEIIDYSKSNHKKSIIFLTGVPGAGKTLAGLNIANLRKNIDESDHAVFLSGNGPLVQVLREALARDDVYSAKERGEKKTKSSADRDVKVFIQNIHHFRDEYLDNTQIPFEKIAIFDEAQRAWQKDQVSKFMKQKKGKDDFEMSEPEFLIDVMNRHEDWCSIVCLIGGGQEINTGEAGISEWISALKNHYPDWKIFISNKILTDKDYLSDEEIKDWLIFNAQEEINLHLSTSIRSFRSEKVSALVHHILEINKDEAQELIAEIHHNYPIYITRNLQTAKDWLRENALGTERIGLVASSGGRRLRAVGIDVKNEIEAPNWFLNSSEDVRSSYFLEDVATEFDIQGLEIDYVCLAWDINMYYENGQWIYKNFSGTKWSNIHNEAARNYLKNAYRVLMTRARQGLIIYLPYGNPNDETRPESLYNQNFEYFKSLGIKEFSFL